jgi:hypothetical protein
MKITKLLVLVLACVFALTGVQVQAQVATKVAWYVLPTSLPDVTTLEFGTARENWLTPLSMGIAPTTSTRVGNVTAIEVRDVFSSEDICVSTNALWRGKFDPGSLYAGMYGQREYGTAIGVALNGMMNIDGVSYRVVCDKVQLLDNQSSFSGLTNSVSRIGIRKGPDGKLFTADDVIVKTGSGTNLVDAVVIIGGRIGALVNNQTDITALDTQITPAGANVFFEYSFNGSKGVGRTRLYPLGGIPDYTNRFAFFKMPIGMLFSVVGPAGSGPFTIESARKLEGAWTTVTTTGTEGSSVYLPYTWNPTNNYGFVRGNGPNSLISRLAGPMVQLSVAEIESEPVLTSRENIPWVPVSDELAQDRP